MSTTTTDQPDGVTAAETAPAARGDSPSLRQIVAFFAMVVGMFVAVLNVQIVGSSFREIQAGLAAGRDEVSWVVTAGGGSLDPATSTTDAEGHAATFGADLDRAVCLQRVLREALELVDRDKARVPTHLHRLDERQHTPVERRGADAERLRRLLADVGPVLGREIVAPEPRQCHQVDLLVLVVTRDMRAFNTFADRHFAEDPAVRRYETSIVKAEIKYCPVVPLDERDATR